MPKTVQISEGSFNALFEKELNANGRMNQLFLRDPRTSNSMSNLFSKETSANGNLNALFTAGTSQDAAFVPIKQDISKYQPKPPGQSGLNVRTLTDVNGFS
jgi:hypothetical protein